MLQHILEKSEQKKIEIRIYQYKFKEMEMGGGVCRTLFDTFLPKFRTRKFESHWEKRFGTNVSKSLR